MIHCLAHLVSSLATVQVANAGSVRSTMRRTPEREGLARQPPRCSRLTRHRCEMKADVTPGLCILHPPAPTTHPSSSRSSPAPACCPAVKRARHLPPPCSPAHPALRSSEPIRTQELLDLLGPVPPEDDLSRLGLGEGAGLGPEEGLQIFPERCTPPNIQPKQHHMSQSVFYHGFVLASDPCNGGGR